MVSGTIVGEFPSAVSVDRLWKATFCDGHNLLPKILSVIISSIDILEGDGAGVGTVKKFNFTDGGALGVKVKSYGVEVCLASTSEGGSLAKMKIEYESMGESLLSEEDATELQQGIFAMVKAVDAHLVENPTAYA
ncbi:hypothetical protein OIU77_007836 [Salix suchowensis]|uniref:Bet v I/Major latex protein domain-containing protein n=1 Tax=Salix suchowensis TaxID=1278906 RepID=A0ABQ9AJR9_9ROSI|nr:hypothetical protein OIU77_007836 [Salix suchowensis]